MPCEQYFLNWFIMEKYVFKLLPCAGGDIVPLSHSLENTSFVVLLSLFMFLSLLEVLKYWALLQ